MERHCYECHDDLSEKGGLDLTAIEADELGDSNYLLWKMVHDRVHGGEMPPSDKPHPTAAESAEFMESIAQGLTAVELAQRKANGRATIRRLNRGEYQNSLREALALPYLDIADSLPPEGSVGGFDKSAEALDFSHVHAAKLMEVADLALRKAVAPSLKKPESKTIRFELRDPKQIQRNCGGLYALLKQSNAMPLVGMKVDETVTRIRGDFQKRDPGSATDEAPFFDSLALFINGEFNLGLTIKPFKIPVAGYYKIRVNGFGVYNDHGELKPSERMETVGFYSNDHTIGFVDLPPYKPTTAEITVWLEPEDVIKPLVASAPFSRIQIPVKTKSGEVVARENESFRKFKAHGVALRWFELEGPIIETWPPESHKRLFDDLPVEMENEGVANVRTEDALADARRLMRRFLVNALRRPITPEDMKIPIQVVNRKLRREENFMEAMISGYRSVLTSPDFLLMQGKAGKLDDNALAERLSYFLWESAPDNYLRNLARGGRLTEDGMLQKQVERMLNDPRSENFVEHFLDKWLKLEDIALTEPDSNLYPDYSPLLMDSSLWESRAYFAEMIKADLGARHIVASDFTMINQRLAELYGFDGVFGNEIRKVSLPENSVRGGFLTQASVLKTTANGTVTSPVVRGDFVLTHLLGDPPPPPPPSVPAVEPDISGATTIREQLDAHREDASCASCHVKIDPPGFALESFDVMGGYRTRYRSLEKGTLIKGLLLNGKSAPTRESLVVDASGELADGTKFNNIREFRDLLLQNKEQIARHLLEQMIVYATGAPIGFADKAEVDRLMAEAEKSGYGVRTMIHLIVQSPLFLNK